MNPTVLMTLVRSNGHLQCVYLQYLSWYTFHCGKGSKVLERFVSLSDGKKTWFEKLVSFHFPYISFVSRQFGSQQPCHTLSFLHYSFAEWHLMVQWMEYGITCTLSGINSLKSMWAYNPPTFLSLSLLVTITIFTIPYFVKIIFILHIIRYIF